MHLYEVLSINISFRTQHPHHKLFGPHFQTENCHIFIRFRRNILGNI